MADVVPGVRGADGGGSLGVSLTFSDNSVLIIVGYSDRTLPALAGLQGQAVAWACGDDAEHRVLGPTRRSC